PSVTVNDQEIERCRRSDRLRRKAWSRLMTVRLEKPDSFGSCCFSQTGRDEPKAHRTTCSEWRLALTRRSASGSPTSIQHLTRPSGPLIQRSGSSPAPTPLV